MKETLLEEIERLHDLEKYQEIIDCIEPLSNLCLKKEELIKELFYKNGKLIEFEPEKYSEILQDRFELEMESREKAIKDFEKRYSELLKKASLEDYMEYLINLSEADKVSNNLGKIKTCRAKGIKLKIVIIPPLRNNKLYANIPAPKQNPTTTGIIKIVVTVCFQTLNIRSIFGNNKLASASGAIITDKIKAMSRKTKLKITAKIEKKVNNKIGTKAIIPPK